MKRRELIVGALAFAVASGRVTARDLKASRMLVDFGRDVLSARGKFVQEVVDQNGTSEGTSHGEFKFVRPNRFSWMILKPYPQTILFDGKELWLYDPDLGQVTVKKIGDAAPTSPASILFGQGDLKKAFEIDDLDKEDGLLWAGALPKKEDVSFSHIRVGFDETGWLRQMRLFDHFGRMTKLTFGDMELNVSIKDEEFVLDLPKGVDVLRDTSSLM